MMLKSFTDRRMAHAAWASILSALLLAGCAPGSWPQLASVERPADAAKPVVLDPIDGADGAAGPANAAPPAAGDALKDAGADDGLAPIRQSAALAEETAERTWKAYLDALDRLLAAGIDEEELISRWSTAQSSLSRFSMAVDMLRDLRDETARQALQFSSGEAGRHDPARLMPTGELLAALGTAAEYRQGQMARENNRLAVLTPPSFGAPGPAAIADGGRTAFAVIDFSKGNTRYADRLTEAVREVRALVPDVALDIVAHGPADRVAERQTALRRVLRDLRGAGVSMDAAAVALGDVSERVEVRIYLRKQSL